LVVFFQPILETQYQPITVEKKSQVDRFANFQTELGFGPEYLP